MPRQREGKQSALEEAPEADSMPSGEARQRSKPRQRIPGPEGRAADSAMLGWHAGQHCSSGSTAGHEAIPCRPLSQTRAGADYPWHGLAMDGGQEALSGDFVLPAPQSSLPSDFDHLNPGLLGARDHVSGAAAAGERPVRCPAFGRASSDCASARPRPHFSQSAGTLTRVTSWAGVCRCAHSRAQRSAPCP
jgi:hypothetical protein